MLVRILATDDVIIKGCPVDDSWILLEALHVIGAKARGGSVPVHVYALPGEATIVYAAPDGASKRYQRIKRAEAKAERLSREAYCPDCGRLVLSMLVDHDRGDDDVCDHCEEARREASLDAAIEAALEA